MKIPKYVYELVELGRLRPAPLDEQANSSIAGQGEYGYMFRVYRKSNSQSGGVFVAEVERITAWARREYAESNIHISSLSWRSFMSFFPISSPKASSMLTTFLVGFTNPGIKPYYKRDYALVTITDPVAQQLEKLIALVSKKH